MQKHTFSSPHKHTKSSQHTLAWGLVFTLTFFLYECTREPLNTGHLPNCTTAMEDEGLRPYRQQIWPLSPAHLGRLWGIGHSLCTLEQGFSHLLGHCAPPSLSNFTRAPPPPPRKNIFLLLFWLTLFYTRNARIRYTDCTFDITLLFTFTLKQTDCAYEDTPQDSHWYQHAVWGCSHVAPIKTRGKR